MNKYDIIIVAEKIDAERVKYSNPYIRHELIGSGIITNSLRSINTLDLGYWDGGFIFYINGIKDLYDDKKSKIISIDTFNEWYSNVIKELPSTSVKVVIIKKGFNE